MAKELQVEPRYKYGITRIDQPEKKNHGFYVRITYRGKLHQKYFPDKSLGGRSKAFERAEMFRNETLAKMPLKKQKKAAGVKRITEDSGYVGINDVLVGKYRYWQIVQTDPSTGKRKTTKFSWDKYGGKEGALEKAKSSYRELTGRRVREKPAKKTGSEN